MLARDFKTESLWTLAADAKWSYNSCKHGRFVSIKRNYVKCADKCKLFFFFFCKFLCNHYLWIYRQNNVMAVKTISNVSLIFPTVQAIVYTLRRTQTQYKNTPVNDNNRKGKWKSNITEKSNRSKNIASVIRHMYLRKQFMRGWQLLNFSSSNVWNINLS